MTSAIHSGLRASPSGSPPGRRPPLRQVRGEHAASRSTPSPVFAEIGTIAAKACRSAKLGDQREEPLLRDAGRSCSGRGSPACRARASRSTDERLALPAFSERVHEPEDEVRGRERVGRVAHHRGVHPEVRPVDARRVHEGDLRRRASARRRGCASRVVWGLSETIATFSPTSRLTSVDLPDVGPADDGDLAGLEGGAVSHQLSAFSFGACGPSG